MTARSVLRGGSGDQPPRRDILYTTGMDRPTEVYVLTRLVLDRDRRVVARNTGVTFDVYEADAHRSLGVENDYETFHVAAEAVAEGAALTEFALRVRELTELLREAK